MSADLRVLYLAPRSHHPGELSRYSFLEEEIRALADAGIEAYVLSAVEARDLDHGRVHVRALPADSMGERARTLGFLARHLGDVPLANLTSALQCYRSVRFEHFAANVIGREGISLIHSYFGWPGGFGGLLARAATGVPLVAGLRGSDVNTLPSLGYGSRLDPFFARAFQRLLRAADCTVYVSEFLRRQAVAIGAKAETGRVILKGVRLDLFSVDRDRDQARAAIGAGPQPLILAVAGLVPIKGLNDILDALAIVRASGREFSFVVCGEGPDRAALETQAKRLRLDTCSRFLGKVSRTDIRSYFAAADLLVHGSRIEASGNVLLEAMASGLPVVCTDAGGPAEYVRDGVTGFVVPVADPAAMAGRITRLLDDPDLRRECGHLARQHAEANFAYERMIGETLAVYRLLLGNEAQCLREIAVTNADASHA